MCALFSPEILQAGAVDGLIVFFLSYFFFHFFFFFPAGGGGGWGVGSDGGVEGWGLRNTGHVLSNTESISESLTLQM